MKVIPGTLNAEKIINYLESIGATPMHFDKCMSGDCWDEYEVDEEGNEVNVDEYEEKRLKIIENLKMLGEIENVDYGEQIDGQLYEKVFHFKNHNIFIKLDDLYYSSYGGTYWDEVSFKQVEPYKRTKVVFCELGTILGEDKNLKYIK